RLPSAPPRAGAVAVSARAVVALGGRHRPAAAAGRRHRRHGGGPLPRAGSLGCAAMADPDASGLHAKVLTVSDGVVHGTREDRSGVALVQRLREAGYGVSDHRVVADGVDTVAEALRAMCHDFAGLVVTTGGTGFTPRDLTPEGTKAVLDREAPGL